MPPCQQGLGQVPDVELHAARHVEGVRADDPDPQRRKTHVAVPLGSSFALSLALVTAYRSRSRSATNTFCSMCHWVGYSMISAPSTSTQACVIRRTCSERGTPVGTGTGGPNVTTTPHGVPAARRRSPCNRSSLTRVGTSLAPGAGARCLDAQAAARS